MILAYRFNPLIKITLIGETRFELATSASRTQRSGQTELLPGQPVCKHSTSIAGLQATINLPDQYL